MNAEIRELFQQQQAMIAMMMKRQEERDEEIRQLRRALMAKEEPEPEPVESSYSHWMSIVRAAQDVGLDFDERDVASLSIEERRKRKIEPRFCDHTHTEEFNSGVLRRIKKLFKDRPSYVKLLSMMYINRYYAVLTAQGRPTYCSKQIMERRDPITDEIRMEVVFVLMGKDAIDSMLGCYKIPVMTGATSDEVKFKDVKASTVWIGCEQRLTFRNIGMNCDSSRPITGMLNMYTPPTYSLDDPLADPKLAQPWLDHLRYNICDGDPVIVEYVFSWIAYVIQRPGRKIGTALAIVGPQGVGKNALFAPVQSILGPHAFESTNADEDVLGSFNAHLAKTTLLVLNEAIWGGDKRKSGKLKGYITDPTLVINGKGRDQYQTVNHMNLVFLSNHDRIVPAEPGERRYFVMRTSNRLTGPETSESEAYFERLRAVPVAAIYKLLMTKDISQFRPRKIPRTDALKQQQLEGLDAPYAFWHEALRDEREIISEVFLTAKECIDLRVAHYEKVENDMSFGDGGLSKQLVPEVYTDEKKLRDEAETHGLIRGELHETKGGYTLAIPWSWYEDEKLILSRIPKKVVYLAFSQWHKRNNNRFKGVYNDVRFWTMTKAFMDIQEHRPFVNGRSLAAELTLPTQHQAKRWFNSFMKNDRFFPEAIEEKDENRMDVELPAEPSTNEQTIKAGVSKSNGCAPLPLTRFEKLAEQENSTPPTLIVEEKEPVVTLSNSDLFDIYEDDPAPPVVPVKSKPPTPKPTIRIAKEVGERTIQVTKKFEIHCAQEPMTIVVTPKLSKPVSRLTRNENGRLSIAPAAATAPKSDPDPTPESQEKRGKYTFVKSGRPFQRQQDATPPEPNPSAPVSSKKLPKGIAVPDTRKPFSFQRTVQRQSVTVGDHEESDYDREESDDAADESDDADY